MLEALGILMLCLCVIFLLFMLWGNQLYKYRREYRGLHKACDMCGDQCDVRCELLVPTPHFKKRNGCLEIPQRPVSRGSYSTEVQIRCSTYKVCSDCKDMLVSMIGEEE